MKTTNRLLIAFAILLSLPCPLQGQVPEPLRNLATPNVSTLGQYGDIPVNGYTGQPNITIPLYEVVEGDIRLPLSLRYDLSSVKPNRHAGLVGFGWQLSYGGQITRIVRGGMDEKQTAAGYGCGYYDYRGKVNEINDANKLRELQEYYMKSIGEKEEEGYELCADEFFFNFCGYSGKFFLKPDGTWAVVSDDDIQVEFDTVNGFINTDELDVEIYSKNAWTQKKWCNRYFHQFTLATPDGTRYTFGGKNAVEYSIPYYNQANSDLTPTTWFLTRIENTAGRVVTIEYSRGTPVCELKYAPFDILSNGILEGEMVQAVGNAALTGHLLFPVYPDSIMAEFVKVRFHRYKVEDNDVNIEFLARKENGLFDPYDPSNLSGARYNIFFDITESSDLKQVRNDLEKELLGEKLYAIEINQGWKESDYYYAALNDTLNKTIYFDYQDGSMKLLTHITERRERFHEYLSSIYGGGKAYLVRDMPDYPSDYTPKDYRFAYYDGKNIPLNFGLSTEDEWGYWNGGTNSFSDRASTIISRKSSNTNAARTGTLKEIVYPTGGKSVFEYGMNQYSKVINPDFISLDESKSGTGGGLRVESITTYDRDGSFAGCKKYHYTDSYSPAGGEGKSSGILKSRAVYKTLFYLSNDKLDVSVDVLDANTPWIRFQQAGGFMAHPTNDDSPAVGYSSVYEEDVDASGNSLGYVRYRYSNYDKDIWGESHLDEPHEYATSQAKDNYANHFSSKAVERGKLMAEETYDASGKLLRSVKYKYQKISSGSAGHFPTVHQQVVYFSTHPAYFSYGLFSSLFKTYTYSYLPSECIETDYSHSKDTVEKKTTYAYNAHKLLKEKAVYENTQDVYRERHLYSSDISGEGLYAAMNGRHILDALVERMAVRNSTVVEGTYLKYTSTADGSYKPCKVYAYPQGTSAGEVPCLPDDDGNPSDSRYQCEREYRYDSWSGNLSSMTWRTDYTEVYRWGYNERYPIAVFRNITEDALLEFERQAHLFLVAPEDYLDALSAYNEGLPQCHVAVYGHFPLVGLRWQCDQRGVMTYYEYDGLGRLVRVKDTNGNTVQEYDYHYVNITPEDDL